MADGGGTYADDHGTTFTYVQKTVDNEQVIEITQINPTNTAATGLDLIIPDMLDGLRVTEISARCGGGYYAYKSVTLGQYVESIASGFLQYKQGVTEVTLNEGLKYIGEDAFRGTSITELFIPDSVETISKNAFNLCSSLEEIQFGTTPQSSHLHTIEGFAFYETAITDLVLPDSLVTIEESAFEACESLKTISWPDNPEFTTINGFNFCENLEDSVLESIPSSVTTLGHWAFNGAQFETITINPSISLIEEEAFATDQFDWGTEFTQRLDIKDGTVPLVIGKNAFYSSYLTGEIILPARVSVLYEGAFSGLNNAAIKIYNPAIDLRDSAGVNNYADSFEGQNLKIYYPDTLTEQTSPSFMAFMAAHQNNPDYTFIPMGGGEPQIVYHNIIGTVPEGAAVSVIINGTAYPQELTDSYSFTCEAPEGSMISVVITMDGYLPKSFERAAGEFTADWDIGNITEDDMTPLSETGRLDLTLEGDGALSANIAIFDGDGALIETGKAKASACIFTDIKYGSYTVLAFADNPFISSVSSIGDLAALGIEEASYSLTDVTIRAGKTTEATIQVPAMDTSSFASYVNMEGCGVLIDKTRVTRNQKFLAHVNYQMAAGHGADSIKIIIPEGFSVDRVSSYTRFYPLESVYNETEHTLTITGLAGSEKEAGTIFVSLSTPNTGSFCISASVRDGSVNVPLGSYSFTVSPVSITTSNTKVTVYAEPGTEVKLKVGTGEEYIFGTTNALGFITDEVQLPEHAAIGACNVKATVTDSVGTFSAIETLWLDIGSMLLDGYNSQIWEFYFLHGGYKNILVENGVDKSGGYYTYHTWQNEWTFSATLTSDEELEEDVYVIVEMVDGSTRSMAMSRIGAEEKDGRFYQTYACTMIIESPGNHIFDKSLVPTGFSLSYMREDKSPRTLDSDEMAYILTQAEQNNITDAWEEFYRQQYIELGYSEDEIEEFLSIDNSDFVFNEGYRYSKSTDPEISEWYSNLSSEDQELVKEIEYLLSELFRLGQEKYGGKRMDQCSGAAEFYESGGVILNDTDYTYTASDLVQDGFKLGANGLTAVKTFRKDDGSIAVAFARKGNGAKSNRGDPFSDVYFESNPEEAARSGVNDMVTSMDLELLNINLEMAERITDSPVGKQFCAKAGKVVSAYKMSYEINQAMQNTENYSNSVVDTAWLQGELDDLNTWYHYAASHGADQACLDAYRRELAAGVELLSVLQEQEDAWCIEASRTNFMALANSFVCLISGGVGDADPFKIGMYFDASFNASNLERSIRIRSRIDRYNEAKARCLAVCDDGSGHSRADYYKKIIYDPSGMVYEALGSNPLEGVKATVINVETGEEWNAEEFAQINPQITGADGQFAWDVPVGLWQVKFEKEGYETAYTEELEVPPPRMNLKIPMVTTIAPRIVVINCYTDYFEIIFDQYMKTGEDSGIEIYFDGTTLNYEDLEWVDVEEGLSKAARFPAPAGLQIGDQVSIEVYNARNYAGLQMGGVSYGGVVLPRPAEIILNYDSIVSVQAGTAKNLTIRVKDNEGNYMENVPVTVTTGNEYLAICGEAAKTDAEGKTTAELNAILPGEATLTVSIDGTTISKEMTLLITVDSNQVARPTAVIGDAELGAGSPKENYVTVMRGSQLTLACETEGAQIFYTTDDTCPCQNNESRNIYTGPITVNENTRFRIAAYKDGMAYSERININVTVIDNVPVESVALLPPIVYLGIGETMELFAHITPENATNRNVTYESSDTSIATVDEYGIVTAGTKPGKAIITVTTEDGGLTATNEINVRFRDVMDPSKYFFKPIYWAAENGITKGYVTASDVGTELYGMFGADKNCTRGDLMVFLWRLAGQPSPGSNNPFSDVSQAELGKTYYRAILWGVKAGITKGYSDGTFRPKATLTRKDIMIMLYRFAGKPSWNFTSSRPEKNFKFNDVIGSYSPGSDTYNAIAWAYVNKITNGYTNQSDLPADSGITVPCFGCSLDCLRKDIMTFIWRYKGKPEVDY
ncbi:MAG: leucine-rich repeat protein [Lachnospiraceae bacterium]|nr:leucine-rich repeat protein [Lachnospiraceae bacterium]